MPRRAAVEYKTLAGNKAGVSCGWRFQPPADRGLAMTIRVTRIGPMPLAEIRADLAAGAELRVAWRRRIGFLTDGRAVRLVTGAEADDMASAGIVERCGRVQGWDSYKVCSCGHKAADGGRGVEAPQAARKALA